MALQGYISTCEATKNGKIEGSCDQENHKKAMMIYEFDFTAYIPSEKYDTAATGRRVYEPIRFVKEIDGATPLLMNALATGDTIKKLVFECWHIANGIEELYYKITLENATITKVHQFKKLTLDPALSHLNDMEEVFVRFGHIAMEHVIAKKAMDDNWLAR